MFILWYRYSYFNWCEQNCCAFVINALLTCPRDSYRQPIRSSRQFKILSTLSPFSLFSIAYTFFFHVHLLPTTLFSDQLFSLINSFPRSTLFPDQLFPPSTVSPYLIPLLPSPTFPPLSSHIYVRTHNTQAVTPPFTPPAVNRGVQ